MYTLDINFIMEWLNAGKKLHRRDWPKGMYVTLERNFANEPFVTEYLRDEKGSHFKISDLLSSEYSWCVAESNYLTQWQVLTELRKGSRVRGEHWEKGRWLRMRCTSDSEILYDHLGFNRDLLTCLNAVNNWVLEEGSDMAWLDFHGAENALRQGMTVGIREVHSVFSNGGYSGGNLFVNITSAWGTNHTSFSNYESYTKWEVVGRSHPQVNIPTPLEQNTEASRLELSLEKMKRKPGLHDDLHVLAESSLYLLTNLKSNKELS